MRMRAGLWWSVVLALLAISCALRTAQGEGLTRTSRRLAVPSAPDNNRVSSSESDAIQPIVRSRGTRRYDETSPQRETVRTRTRNRPEVTPTAPIQPQLSKNKELPSNNERFDSRRTRTRSQPVDIESKTQASPIREPSVRGRTRASSRPFSTTTTSTSTTTSSSAPLELTSPTVDKSTIDIINSSTNAITKNPNQLSTAATPSRRRNTIPTSTTTETVVLKRSRGRINTRSNSRPLDLSVSGTINTLSIADKTPTTARTSGDSRNAKKLRYRTRSSETDNNLTGEGLIVTNKVTNSSQNNESNTSQLEAAAPLILETIVQPSTTESNKHNITTVKVARVVRRPLKRGNLNFRPTASLPKVSPVSDEISEDDNYPPSFKALIQAKNASTHASSTNSENLSLTASQKVYTTHSTSTQSTITGLNKKKFTRLRNKQAAEESSNSNKVESKISNENVVPEISKPKTSENRLRPIYNPRNRKSTFIVTSTQSSSSSSAPDRPVNKYNRKFKASTTVAPKSEPITNSNPIEHSDMLKKAFVRPPFYTRKLKGRMDANIETPIPENDKNSVDISQKIILPRTSFYARSRNVYKKQLSTTEETTTEKVGLVINKTEETFASPLILSLLNTSEDPVSIETQPENKNNHMFLVTVTSKESLETNTNNDITNTAEESENKPVVNLEPTIPSKQDSDKYRYHANYKDHNTDNNIEKENTSSTVVPPVRNLQTKKYRRHRVKNNINDELSASTPKSREKSVRKFSDSFSKSTEPSNNGITPEPEKSKSRFSSKYRASYIDKPFYKPTVPTITSSTAWLKFYITDQLLTKSIEEPYWFQEDIYTTEPVSRLNTTPYIHESSIEMVEGEEIQLGPDMNAISFTQTRKKLSSADLKLSESLVKPSHVMNVEASHHSPSVTISIFDALAEILTSTPKPQISSTTEITAISSTYTDVKQVNTGVSNNINVNSVQDSTSQDTFMSTNADISTSINTVQSNVQAPNVINSISVEGTVTQPLNLEDNSVTPVNTLSTPNPDPPSSTPVSARKPFAIRVLYSDTESATDKFTTATTSNRESTDTPKMVYKSVSDLLLSNNNVVSSELTSMLSNNIQDIIENMDVNSRSMLNTVDMEKILKTLIPRALDRLANTLDKADSIPNTTPYSLEDIKDTENVDIDGIESNALQSVAPVTNVNITVDNRNEPITDTQSSPVNSSISPAITESTQSVPSTVITTTVPTANTDTDFVSSTTESQTLPTVSTARETLPNSLEVDSTNVNNNIDGISTDTTNKFVPIPFLTNFQAEDFTLSNGLSTLPTPLLKSVSSSVSPTFTNDPISPLQLWVLSKKAQVLKMIEDLIRQHNDELATAPSLVDFVRPSDNLNLTERLADIMNGMVTNTETTLSPDADNRFPTTTQSLIPNPLSTDSLKTTSSIDPEMYLKTTTPSDTLAVKNNIQSTTESQTTIASRFGSLNSGSDTSDSFSTTVASDVMSQTIDILNTSPASTLDIQQDEVTLNQLQDGTMTTDTPEHNTEMIETTTSNVETTTQLDLEITTSNVDITTTEAAVDNITPTTVSTLSIGTRTVPKKDYVIFGILPNNTVVRKDPNEDVLESLIEASPYIVYGVLPNNTIIRKFPNGTRVPRVMQKIDILPISPWSLRNPYSPIHNNPAIVRPQFNPIRVSTNTVPFTDTSNNGTESLTNDTVNNQQIMISTSALNIKSSSGLTTTIMPEKSTASHVLSLRTTTMLPSIDEILLNSISSAAKQDMVISEMTSSTREPRILTLDIDPETKEIRTEKPGEANGSAVFKFIPIDEIMIKPQGSNVLKLASTKIPTTDSGYAEQQTEIMTTVTAMNTQSSQIQSQGNTAEATTSSQIQTTSISPETTVVSSVFTNAPVSTQETTPLIVTSTTPVSTTITLPTTTTTSEQPITIASTVVATTTQIPTTTQVLSTITPELPTSTLSIQEELKRYQDDVQLLQSLLLATGRDPKSLNLNINTLSLGDVTTTGLPKITSRPITTIRTTIATDTTTIRVPTTAQQNDPANFLQALFTNQDNPTTKISPNLSTNTKITTAQPTTTTRSIEDDIKQFEEDTKFLQALLQATGQNPSALNIPSLDRLTTIRAPTTAPETTTISTITSNPTTVRQTTTVEPTTTQSIENDLKQFQEDTKLLQALLQATGQNPGNSNPPIVSGVTSSVRIASNPQTTSLGSNPTTPLVVRPVYTTTNGPTYKTFAPRTVTSTLQPTTENVRISTTFRPFNQRRPSTTTARGSGTLTGRRAPFTSTTEIPSTSTFSVEEDLAFLQNLKTVLKTNPTNDDPEAALANRIIALAVEKSLNEIQTSKPDTIRTGKNIGVSANNLIPTTNRPTTTTKLITTTTTTTTTPPPSTTQRITTTVNGPSIDDDIRQFQEDTKLLQALLKATGQDPSKLNIPTLPPNLDDVQETTTQKNNRLTITGQSADEALKKLAQQPVRMISEATQTPMSLSTEYGKSNDALLAALLKEQGFGPTTPSSLDEQLRLAALLNQVVVTPKARRTTTAPPPPPPPPPPAQRRPILDGLAWLWQQWRETAPGSGPPRPNRGPPPAAAPSARPSVASSSSSNRVNWLGSGPFVGNAEDRPGNRIPLEPPRSVAAEQPPGRGQLVSAAINVTRAFSQFLGAAIQGAAQTVQSVIRAGQRAASDVYVNGAGSG